MDKKKSENNPDEASELEEVDSDFEKSSSTSELA